MSSNPIPDSFVWTKIQADAGETVAQILNRKELERLAGSVFWWGIGESKARAIASLCATISEPIVLFSLMLGKPHLRDSAPEDVLLWRSYIAKGDERPLPAHVVVTSRARDRSGRPKMRHYALACTSTSSIRAGKNGTLDVAALRNIGGRAVGSSQVTAVVERVGGSTGGPVYPITARAHLHRPYAVTLAAPRILSSSERRLLVEIGANGGSAADWRTLSTKLKDH